MNILFLAHRVPYPPNKGDKIRSYHEIRYLSNYGKIFLGTLYDFPGDAIYAADLKSICTDICAMALNPIRKKILSVPGQLLGKPASVGYFYNRHLQGWVDRTLQTNQIDLVFCFSSTMAEYLYRSTFWEELSEKNIRILMDYCDVDSVKWLDYGKIKKWPLSVFFYREGLLLQQYEQKIADTFDTCFLASDREKKLFDDQHHADNVQVLQNGVDLEYFRCDQDRQNPSEKPVLVFTGAMDYDVNIDGVCWFVRKIWPVVKSACPDVRFYIVGSNPAREVERLTRNRDVYVTGFVDDIREYYNLATVCIAPLRIARGIQNKVLEALAMSRPVVCTSSAFEGINAVAGRDLLVCDREDDFAAQILCLFEDSDLRRRLAVHGRRCMEKHYSWDAQLDLLRSFLPTGEQQHQGARP